MLTVSPPTTGNDPECGFAELHPELHACTDRDGAPVAGDKACFAWARHTLLNPAPALTVVEDTEPACPACARPIHQNTERRAHTRNGRYTEAYVVADPTWRHHDGTVALSPAGTLSCAAVAA